MLSEVTKSFKSVIVTIFIGLLLISLAIWGVSDAFSPRSKNAAAMVGGEPIELQDFYDTFNRRLKDANKDRPERLTTEQAYRAGFHTQVLNLMIADKLVQLDADDLGLAVNKRDARQYAEDLEIFNSEITGKLDEQKLMSRLSQIDRSLTRKKFEEQIQSEIRRTQVLAGITGGIAMPDSYSDQQYRFMTEQRKVKFLKLNQNAITLPDDPSDEDLETYISENQNQYIAPEYRRFILMRMEMSDVLPDTDIIDEELQDRLDYKIKAQQIGTPETRSLTQYVADTKDIADNIATALREEETQEAILAEFNVQPPIIFTDVPMSGVTDPKASDTGFEMLKGDVKTIEGSFGTWYALKLDTITPAFIPTLESERDVLSEEVRKEKAQLYLSEAFDTIQKNIDDGMTIEEAALESKISASSYDFISRLGQTHAGQTMNGNEFNPGIAKDDKLLKEIFTTDPGFEGDLFETSNGGIAAIRIEDIKESTPRSFESVKDKALANWRLEKTTEALAELSNKTLERANAGESYEEIAASFKDGAKVEDSMIMRAVSAPDLGPQLAIRLYESRIDQNVSGFAGNGIERIIGTVTEIIPNEDLVFGEVGENLKTQTIKSINDDLLQSYHAALLKQYPAKIMSQNIERALGIDQN